VTISFTYECKNPRKFPAAYLLDVSYLAWIVNSTEAVLEEAMTRPNREKFRYWFGDFGAHQEARFQEAQLRTGAMLEHARSHAIEFNQISETTLAKTDQSKAALELNLGTYTSLGLYSLGELVVTFVHEISHKTPGLMTDDVSTGKTDIEGGPISAYKGDAVKLANSKPSEAFRNAENWGYYIASYHREVGFTDNFQHTSNLREIESKVIPGSVSPQRGEHWNGSTWILHEGRGCVPNPGGKPIVKYCVSGEMVFCELADTGLPGSPSASVDMPSNGVVHVAKAITSDGPHKCSKCGRGFVKIAEKYEHLIGCKG
jgi:hypothetical protein